MGGRPIKEGLSEEVTSELGRGGRGQEKQQSISRARNKAMEDQEGRGWGGTLPPPAALGVESSPQDAWK